MEPRLAEWAVGGETAGAVGSTQRSIKTAQVAIDAHLGRLVDLEVDVGAAEGDCIIKQVEQIMRSRCLMYHHRAGVGSYHQGEPLLGEADDDGEVRVVESSCDGGDVVGVVLYHGNGDPGLPRTGDSNGTGGV